MKTKVVYEFNSGVLDEYFLNPKYRTSEQVCQHMGRQIAEEIMSIYCSSVIKGTTSNYDRTVKITVELVD